jgi:hypothetical protein
VATFGAIGSFGAFGAFSSFGGIGGIGRIGRIGTFDRFGALGYTQETPFVTQATITDFNEAMHVETIRLLRKVPI